jgi:chaperonin cofactor prefoldin
MARVVQRRSNPPYLLIIFVFLFLVATTLAVLQYMEADRLRKESAELQQQLRVLASSADTKRPIVSRIMSDYPTERKTVVAQLLEYIERLAGRITPAADGYEEAMASIQALEQRHEGASQGGLIDEVLDLHRRNDRLDEQIASLNRDIEQRNTRIQALQETIQQANQKLESRQGELAGEIESLNQSLSQREQAHRQQLETVQEEFAQIRRELSDNIASKTTQIDTLQFDLQKKDAQISKLESVIQDLKGFPSDPNDGGVVANPARLADGRILRVVEGSDVCYINIGSKDRVMPGLTFSVYSPQGIPVSGEGKAKIIVTNVSESVSECRIASRDPADPVIAGDLIGNVVFDALRTNVFVIQGQFDLFGQGEPTEQGAKEVASLVRRFGGKVVDSLDIQTDFVIMGAEPTRPVRPAEDAQPQAFAIYEAQLKAYERYNELRSLAQSLGIPVLNTGRFLAFTGYQPQQTVRY